LITSTLPNATDPIKKRNAKLPRKDRETLPSWICLHRGKVYAEDVLLWLEPIKFAICILHLLLRFVAHMLKNSLLIRVKDNPKLAEVLFNWLVDDVGIHISRILKTADNASDFFKSVAEHNFHGAEASAMLTAWQAGMDLVYTEADRKKRNEKKKYDSSCAVWKHFADKVWKVLSKEKPAEEKAVLIKDAGLKMLTLWTTAFGESGIQYLHYLPAHLPTQILELPVDIWHLQIQSLEHQNKIRKELVRKGLSNAHKPGKQTFSQVKEYNHHRTGTLCVIKEKKDASGNIVRAKGLRWSGTCMSYQLMHISALTDYVNQAKAHGKVTAKEFDKIRHKQRLKKEAARRRLRIDVFDNDINSTLE
jgi:hypothetical protein